MDPGSPLFGVSHNRAASPVVIGVPTNRQLPLIRRPRFEVFEFRVPLVKVERIVGGQRKAIEAEPLQQGRN